MSRSFPTESLLQKGECPCARRPGGSGRMIQRTKSRIAAARPLARQHTPQLHTRARGHAPHPTPPPASAMIVLGCFFNMMCKFLVRTMYCPWGRRYSAAPRVRPALSCTPASPAWPLRKTDTTSEACGCASTSTAHHVRPCAHARRASPSSIPGGGAGGGAPSQRLRVSRRKAQRPDLCACCIAQRRAGAAPGAQLACGCGLASASPGVRRSRRKGHG
jgi:hypothetical protein